MVVRWLTGIAFGFVAFLAAWGGSYWWLLFLMALLWLASSDWRQLGKLNDVFVDVPIVLAGLLFTYVGTTQQIRFLAFLPLLLVFPAVSLLVHQKANRSNNMVWTAAGIIWLSLPASLLFLLRVQYGIVFLLILLMATIIQDTFALYSGMIFGGDRPFAPGISPNKTWAGFVGSFIGSLAVFISAGMFYSWPTHLSLSLGLLLGAIGQVGDLSISGLKRRVSLDDTGGFFPGHGGILDRVDGLIFNVAAFYPFCFWLSDYT